MAKKQGVTPAKASARKAPAAKKRAPRRRVASTRPVPAAAKPKSLKPIFAGPVKPAPAAPASPAKKAKQDSAPAIAKKPKLVRDSFTMPKAEYAVLEQLKKRAHSLGRKVKKSELLRAGLHAIAAMGDGAFAAAVDLVPRIKTGRPKDRDASKA